MDAKNMTLLSVYKMITDENSRAGIVCQVEDPVTRDFWQRTFVEWPAHYRLEALGAIATIRPTKPVLRTPRDQALCFARTCYDHLAGTLGVELAAALEGKGIVTATEDRKYALGPDGPSWLTRWAIEDPSRRARHREFASRCLDWTERRPHIGGALGATLLASFIERRWLQRKPESRAMRITERGMRGFAELGIPALAIHHSSSPAYATYSKGARSA